MFASQGLRKMFLQKYSLGVLSTALLVALTSQSSAAFSIKYVPRPQDSFAISRFGNSTGITSLNAADPEGDPFPSNFLDRLSVCFQKEVQEDC